MPDLQRIRNEIISIAKEHKEADPTVSRVLWFPSTDEIRVVDVVKNYPYSESTEEIDVFQFNYELDGEKIDLLIGSVDEAQIDFMPGPRSDWGAWSTAEVF